MDVRRLAAIDMFGTRGTLRRRRIILAEFTLATVGAVAFGAWLVSSGQGAASVVLGLYVIGVGLNYVPLSLHAIALSRPGALDAELQGVDTTRELRRYSVLQVWVFVPLALVVLAVRDLAARR